MFKNYKFGDLTKGAIGLVGGAVKEFTGKDEYHFGDITRTVIGKTVEGLDAAYKTWVPPPDTVDGARILYGEGVEHVDYGSTGERKAPETASATSATGLPDVPTGAGAGSGHGTGAGVHAGASDGSTAAARPSKTSAYAASLPRARYMESVTMQDIWGSFFTSCVAVGVGAGKAGMLTEDAVDDREAYVYIGLTGLAMLEAALRSVVTDVPGIMLSHGIVIRADAVPNDPPEVRRMFTHLNEAKESIAKLGFACGVGDAGSPEATFLRRTVLFASSEEEVECAATKGLSEDAKAGLRRIASVVQGIAIEVTQMPFFKSNFEAVLEDLSGKLEGL